MNILYFVSDPVTVSMSFGPRLMSFGFQTEILDDPAPARVLRLKENGVFLRRVGNDLESHFEKLIPCSGLRDHLQYLAVQSVHDRPRRRSRRENPEPREDFETRE